MFHDATSFEDESKGGHVIRSGGRSTEQIVKKSAIAKMEFLWNGNVKEINGINLVQIKKYAKKKFMQSIFLRRACKRKHF